MALSTANINIATDTFATWVTKTNELAYDMTTYAVTANSTAGITTGNTFVKGIAGANTIVVNNGIRGGNVETSGTLNITTAFTSNNLSIYTTGQVSLTTATANQLVDSVSTTTYRSSKYMVQVSTGVGYQCSEILLLHDGTNSFITEYASLITNGTQAVFSANINSGSLQLLVTPTQTTSTVTFQRISIVV